ncbi:MAG: glutamate-5-semialdehyde dehydrogenase [Acidobacteria bacterium]|nr:MAG: glutamate-5-semialdehyde dehydrogenase [Acidobacteriota bacterium]MCE7958766.1 glutamate-5-semialdehyde dehydrogenase [Acidobacteria bacterium ACB2]
MSQNSSDPSRVRAVAEAARAAYLLLSASPSASRERALHRVADLLSQRAAAILAANAEDVAEARRLVGEGKLARPLLDRLKLDPQKLLGMARSLREVAAQPDPSGRVLEKRLLDEGLLLEKVTCPLGVVAAVFESRPDAVTQIASLAIRSGNAVVLKGGSEAVRTTAVLVALLREALASEGLPEDAVASLAGREEVDALLALDDLVDLVVPRGSNALVRSVKERTRIPVLGHADGVCHVYVDAAADPDMAIAICLDAKTTYPAACNAVETILVHRAAAPEVLRPLVGRLAEAGVEVRGCEETCAMAAGMPLVAATEADFGTEFSALVVAVKVVETLDEAIAHVNRFGSGHTDAIVTQDRDAAARFLSRVDSAGVYHNASTRFADGYRYGLGAELGISTGRLHARGPVGLEGLVTYRWRLHGMGHLVATYTGPGAKPFLHRKL